MWVTRRRKCAPIPPSLDSQRRHQLFNLTASTIAMAMAAFNLPKRARHLNARDMRIPRKWKEREQQHLAYYCSFTAAQP